MADALYDAVRGLPHGLAVLIVAMVPIAELRGAIPLGLLGFDMPAAQTFLWAFVGNMIPVPAIVFALEPVSNWLRRHSRLFDRFFDKLFSRTREKHSWRFERFRDAALISFVAIPLPMTGAWTGALAAFLFGIPARRALPLIASGVAIAGCIVSALVLAGLRVFGISAP